MTRRLISLALALIMVLALCACGFTTAASTETEDAAAQTSPEAVEEAAEEAAEEPAELPQFRVGMECAYAPSNWQESEPTDTNVPIDGLDGAYAEGYDVQIARYLADQLGYELVIVKLSWEGLIEALNQGRIDAIIAGMADTAERRESINFSVPYHSTTYGLMLKADSPFASGTTINDFAGASVLGQQNTMLDTVIDQMEGVNHLPPVASVPNMLSRLAEGTCDAIVVNVENSEGYLAMNPDCIVIEFADGDGFDLGFQGSCVGLRKDDTELLAQIDEALTALGQEAMEEMWAAAVEAQPS